ncbi:MAG: tryptophan-rich sensory protein [Acidobacteriota bacterium]|nr:tryptophan-rich sensory protein [Acidobacteriota bacterium]
MANTSERIRQFSVIAATVGVIVFNYLAASGALGGIETGAVSDKYPTLVTPAGYAFAIWSLIYLGIVAFSIYQALPKNLERFRFLRTVYILSCAANCAWLYFWHQEAILVSVAVIFLLLGTLAFINIKLQTTDTLGEFWLAKFPFGIYFGWVTAAAIVNAAVVLVYLNVQVSDSLAVMLGAGLVLIATVLGIIIRFKLNNVFYSLAIAWALTAIAVKQSGQTLIVASAAVAVNILLIVTLTFLINLRSSSSSNE